MKREQFRDRCIKAKPGIFKALGVAVLKLPAGANGVLGDIILADIGIREFKDQLISRGKTSDDLVKYMAHITMCQAGSGWRGIEELIPLAKKLGIDIKKLIDELVPENNPDKKKGSKK